MKKQKNLTLTDLRQMMWDSTDSRQWEEHFYPDQLAKSVAIEATDLLKEFQWLDNMQISEFICEDSDKKRVAFKIVDVLYYTIMLAESMEIDVAKYTQMKLRNQKVK